MYHAPTCQLNSWPPRVNSILGPHGKSILAARVPDWTAPLVTLPADLVEEGRPRRGHVEGAHPPGQGDPDQDVAGPGDKGSQPMTLASQDEDNRPAEVHHPGSLGVTFGHGSDDPAPLLLQALERLAEVSRTT
jgi:hypothetical protein